jgi:hypothetical protein
MRPSFALRLALRPFVCAILACALAAPGVGAADEGGKKAKTPYLELETVAVSVVRPNGRRGVMTVQLGLDAPQAALRDRLQLYLPRLHSAYVSALQPYAYGLAPGALPNADYIAYALQRETDRVLGQSGAKLLLGSILVN